MDRVFTAAPGANVPSAGTNTVQDNALGIAQVSGLWVGGRRPHMRNVDASNAVIIGATPGLVLGTSVVLPAKTETTLAGGAGGAGLYFVYASNSSGAIAYEISATAPDAYNLFMSGNAAKVYVGPVYKTGASNVRPFRQHGGTHRIQTPPNAITGGSHSATATPTALDSGATQVPPNARVVWLRATLVSTNDAAKASLFVIDNGSNASGDEREVLACSADSGTADVHAAAAEFEVCLSETRNFYWRTSAAGGDTVTVDLVGWLEN